MNIVDFEGRRLEVMHVVDPQVAVIFLGGAVQGCAEVIAGELVANLSADGSAMVSEGIVAKAALLGWFGVG